jgi:hypothetical protein
VRRPGQQPKGGAAAAGPCLFSSYYKAPAELQLPWTDDDGIFRTGAASGRGFLAGHCDFGTRNIRHGAVFGFDFIMASLINTCCVPPAGSICSIVSTAATCPAVAVPSRFLMPNLSWCKHHHENAGVLDGT